MTRVGAEALFRTVPRSDHLGFWANHTLDAGAVARFLNLKKADVAKVADVAPGSVRFDQQIPREVRTRLAEIASVCEAVAQYFGGDPGKTALWFRTPNPMLGNISPRDMIRFGRYEKLRQFIQEALTASQTDEWSEPLQVLASATQLRASLHGRELEGLCRAFGVRRLAAFGSATRADFQPGRSDVDLAVEFSPVPGLSPARQYFDFKEALERLFGTPVDLVELSAMADSRLKRTILRSQIPLYGEAA